MCHWPVAHSGCGAHFVNVVEMYNNAVCKCNLLKPVLSFEYQCLEPTYACRTDFFTPNEEHLNLAINNYNVLKYNYCCYSCVSSVSLPYFLSLPLSLSLSLFSIAYFAVVSESCSFCCLSSGIGTSRHRVRQLHLELLVHKCT